MQRSQEEGPIDDVRCPDPATTLTTTISSIIYDS